MKIVTMRSDFPLTFRKQNEELLFQIDQFCETTTKNYYPLPISHGDCFYLLWIREGKGKCLIDGTEFPFEENTFFSFIPNHPFSIYPNEEVKGVSIYFHSNFYCMSSHVKELSANVSVFKRLYSSSILNLSNEVVNDFTYLEKKMIDELSHPNGIAKGNVLISYLKLFLINIARIRLEQMQKTISDIQIPETLLKLEEEIELNFRKIHSPSLYADKLHIATKSLNKLVKKYYNKTLTQIIQERIILEAQKELNSSNKPIKNIAFELGFTDAFYFSRLFKKKLRVSPENYRIEKVQLLS